MIEKNFIFLLGLIIYKWYVKLINEKFFIGYMLKHISLENLVVNWKARERRNWTMIYLQKSYFSGDK